MTTPEIRIRNYRPGDHHELMAFWKENGLTYPERGDDLQTIQASIDEHGGKMLIMTDSRKGDIIGSSWMTCDGRRIFLHHFGIREDFRGCGLGRLLMEKSMEYVREKGLQLKLEVHRDNLAAKNIYEEYDFEIFREYEIYMLRDTATFH